MTSNLTTFPYTQTQTAIFENIFKLDQVLLNHAVIEPGQIFPKHPTDAAVYAIIVRGVLSIAIEDGAAENYQEGQVVHIPKGVASELGNRSEALVELFVIKTDL